MESSSRSDDLVRQPRSPLAQTLSDLVRGLRKLSAQSGYVSVQHDSVKSLSGQCEGETYSAKSGGIPVMLCGADTVFADGKNFGLVSVRIVSPVSSSSVIDQPDRDMEVTRKRLNTDSSDLMEKSQKALSSVMFAKEAKHSMTLLLTDIVGIVGAVASLRMRASEDDLVMVSGYCDAKARTNDGMSS